MDDAQQQLRLSAPRPTSTITLNTFKINGTFVWDHTYAFSAGYFSVNGSQDAGLYGSTSLANSPNGNGLVFDLSYAPFSHGSPGPYSTYNARLGVQYTKYLQLYGGTSNFDGLIGTPGAGGAQRLGQQHAVALCGARLLRAASSLRDGPRLGTACGRQGKSWRFDPRAAGYRARRIVLESSTHGCHPREKRGSIFPPHGPTTLDPAFAAMTL